MHLSCERDLCIGFGRSQCGDWTHIFSFIDSQRLVEQLPKSLLSDFMRQTIEGLGDDHPGNSMSAFDIIECINNVGPALAKDADYFFVELSHWETPLV